MDTRQPVSSPNPPYTATSRTPIWPLRRSGSTHTSTISSTFSVKITSYSAKMSCSVRLLASHSLAFYSPVIPVIGTLEAADYALFVSHSHPDGQVNFNVFASSKLGQPWGEFSTTTATDLSASAMSGPVYHEEVPRVQANSKVSRVRKASEPWDTVLVARLRFAPDREEPTVL